MAPTSDDDLDWLYGRSSARPADDTTRVMGPDELAGLDRGSPPANAPSEDPVAPSARPGMPPSGGRPLGSMLRADAPRVGPRPGNPGGTPLGAPAARPGSSRGFGGGSTVLPSPPGSSLAPRPSRRRHPVRRTIAVLLTLLVAWLVFLVAVPLYAWSRMTTVDSTPGGARPASQPGTAVLLVGSDSREGLTKEQRSKLGTGSVEGRRTDTMMILYTAPGGQSALVSLPRDLYLPIPGHGSNKLNAAYSLGGPQLLVRTVEQNTGLRMDGYVEIGFAGFVGMVDAVGGVRVCLSQPMVDRDSHTNLPKGCQTLDGSKALGYVRMRKADPLGDIGRAQRQRQVVAAVVKKAASPATLLNPFRYSKLVTSGTESVRRGQDTTILDALAMARGMYSVTSGTGTTLVVPIANANAITAAGSSVLWDEALAKQLFAQLARGDATHLNKYTK